MADVHPVMTKKDAFIKKKKTVCDLFINTCFLLTNGMNQIKIFTRSSQKCVRKLVVQWKRVSLLENNHL